MVVLPFVVAYFGLLSFIINSYFKVFFVDLDHFHQLFRPLKIHSTGLAKEGNRCFAEVVKPLKIIQCIEPIVERNRV